MAKRKAPVRHDPRERLIAAALALAARQGWRRTSLGGIAAEAKLPLHEAYALFRSKSAILAAFRRDIDAAVLAEVPLEPDADETARDRLFEVLMRRFEALKPHRPALKSILRESLGHPGALCGLAGLMRSMGWMLEAAGISLSGCRRRLTINLLSALYLAVLRVFLDDASADLGLTMAALDRRLRQGESLLGFAANFGGGRRRKAA
jgi:AcrR family transcriptional regulator